MKHWQKISKRINLKKLTPLEKLLLQHAEPVNLVAHLIAAVVLGYGLWINNLNYVVLAVLLSVAGHLYTHLKK